MRKITNLLLAVTTLLLFMTSCGAKHGDVPKDKKITVSNINISGDGNSYLKVVPGDVIVRVIEDKLSLSIRLELIKKYPGQGPEMGNLSLTPLDKSGSPIPDIGLDFMPASSGEWSKIKDLLSGEVGKQATISFKWDYFSNEEKQARIMKEIEGFELTRADITNLDKDEEQSSTNTVDNSTSNESTFSDEGSENWDKLLDDYESYTNDYIKFWKKAQAGDESAMIEYPAMLESSTKLSVSLAAAQKDNRLSAKQLVRMTKIQNKMVSLIGTE